MSEVELRVLATRCHTSSCCPTILESPDGEEVVIVGGIASALLASASVQERVGTEEAAVVIPKSLLLEACNVMLFSNNKISSPDHGGA
jgi:hypothetical protein